MTISVQCPECGKSYQLRDELAGQQAKCKCGAVVAIPQPAAMQNLLDEELEEELAGPAVESESFPADGAMAGDAVGTAAGPLGTLPARRPQKTSRNPVVIVAVVAGGVAVLALIGLVFFLVGGGGGGGKGGGQAKALGYASPQEAFDAHKNATIDKDWQTQINCLTPEGRDQLVGSMASMAAGMAREKPEFADLLRRYGVDESVWKDGSSLTDAFSGRGKKDLNEALRRIREKQKSLAAVIHDKAAFYAEVMEHFEELGKEAVRKFGGNRIDFSELQEKANRAQAEAQLVDLKIDGDIAEGKQSITFGSRPLKTPVSFKRINGRWYLHSNWPGQKSSTDTSR